jgi:hypothetical protein
LIERIYMTKDDRKRAVLFYTDNIDPLEAWIEDGVGEVSEHIAGLADIYRRLREGTDTARQMAMGGETRYALMVALEHIRQLGGSERVCAIIESVIAKGGRG